MAEYVLAGFTKIHLDASMPLGEDDTDGRGLDPSIIAERTALLCKAAEAAYHERRKRSSKAVAPVYVVGTEVPAPGGVAERAGGVQVTTPEEFRQTVSLTKDAFLRHGLDDAWERVVGVVVQPGVEFGDDWIQEYDRRKATSLTRALREYPSLVFEGHSTDYQQPQALREMVEDGVGVLKVGPELTFTFREALFLLEHMERELFWGSQERLSNLQTVLEDVMVNEPGYWRPYYRGSQHKLRLARRYSLSDRIRYYWQEPRVNTAVQTLIANLEEVSVPLSLLSQYMPNQYAKVRRGALRNDPRSLIKDRISEVYEKYQAATHCEGL